MDGRKKVKFMEDGILQTKMRARLSAHSWGLFNKQQSDGRMKYKIKFLGENPPLNRLKEEKVKKSGRC